MSNTLDTPFRWVYQEITHSSQGFGLCHARNVGLELASGELVAYLDDDNSLQPHFVAAMIEVFETQRSTRCCLPQQWRRRDVLKHGEVIRSGTPFISPSDRCTVKALIQQQELFDSNGFTHYRDNCPQWNPDYRVFADYEYFLQSLGYWGSETFQIYSQVLVNYVQRSNGVIGQSNYQDWVSELALLSQQQARYSCLLDQDEF
jgi:glycosyltransferase involved in cell wall biosynthesis